MDINDKSLQYLTSIIEESKTGFDIEVLDKWYYKIIEYTKDCLLYTSDAADE